MSKKGTRKPSQTKHKPKNQGVGIVEHKVVEEGELLAFLLEVMPTTSRNSVKSILKRGQVTVNGKATTQHNHPIKPGQIIGIQTNQKAMQEKTIVGIEIMYEDDDFIVISKDAGILSVAMNGGGFEPTAHNQLMTYVRQTHPKNRVYIVHRLDRDTSGVMVFAKNEEMKEKLQENWKEAVLERKYTALVEGDVRRDSDTISSWLKESKSFKVHSAPFDNGGKHAVTHYKKIRSNGDFSLLEVQLETGRKNQIRVHMEEIGHPVVGDKKYSARTNPLKRLGLHATTLIFIHPRTGEQLEFHASVPKKFTKTLSKSKQS